MKKKFLIGLTVLLSALFINASAQDSKGFIGISGGYSAPFGNISTSVYLDTKSGFAKGGPQFALDGAYFFNKHIGLGALVTMGSYGVDSSLGAGYVEAFAVDEVTVTSGRYKTMNILPAFYLTFPFNKLNLDFRVMAGYFSLTTAKIQVQLEDNTETPLIQDASTGGGFGFGMGVGLRYAFTKHFGAALKLDFLDSKPNVTVTNQNINNPTEKLRVVTKYNESIPEFHGLIGLTYDF